ncbi:SRPBCC family protein [Ekhidna lutea]|nr:SRPBCC domain-containing protein [Ekhidna lutea]
MKDVLRKEKTFTHSIDKVWNAISVGEEISKWFIQADFKPEIGYEYTFTAAEEHGGTQIKGKVLEASPYTLKYTWRVGDTEVDTTVLWTLEEADGGTKLTLEHSDISNYPAEAATEMLGHFDKGWDACITGLIQYLKDEISEPAH